MIQLYPRPHQQSVSPTNTGPLLVLVKDDGSVDQA